MRLEGRQENCLDTQDCSLTRQQTQVQVSPRTHCCHEFTGQERDYASSDDTNESS